MAIYTGTRGQDAITPEEVTAGVRIVPAGSGPPSAVADTINGRGGNDTLDGGGGADSVNGGAGEDTIYVRGAGSVMRGGTGSDTMSYYTDEDDVSGSAYGGAGNDSIRFYSAEEVGGASPGGTLSFYGGTGSDRLEFDGINGSDYSELTVNSYGEAGNDRLEAFSALTFSNYMPWFPGARDYLYGGTGNDSYLVLEPTDAVIERPHEGHDTVEVYRTDYTLPANIENLVVNGSDHWDHRLTGNALNNNMTSSHSYAKDTIDGLEGNDELFGQGGDDILIGSAGADRLSGGSESDIYDYNAVAESQRGGASRDVILDFHGIGAGPGDRIDLSGIDAIPGGSDDAFTFIGTAAFTAPGQVRVRDLSAPSMDTLVQANTAGASGAELEIAVMDSSIQAGGWTGSDFIL